MLRAKREACHAVGVAVDVHELAFERKRIGAHEEEIGIEVLQIDGSLLFGRGRFRAVEHGVAPASSISFTPVSLKVSVPPHAMLEPSGTRDFTSSRASADVSQK